MQFISSKELVLTSYHMSMLERNATKFQAADTNCWEQIIQDTANNIKDTWIEGMEFDRDAMIKVSELSDRI